MTAIKIGFFDKDHDPSGLEGLASSCEFHNFESIDEALKSSVASLFVHVIDDDWKNLCVNLSKERVALRFSSTVLYPRSLPEGMHGNCFRCLKPTKNEGKIEEEEFKALVAVFSNLSIVHQFRNTIPKEIRGLVSNSTVHRLRALHILLQACMVEWVNNLKHGTDAIELLRYHPEISSTNARPNRAGLFYRILTDRSWGADKSNDLEATIAMDLQQELGVNSLDSEYVNLVKEVLKAGDENVSLSWETTKAVFEKLDKELGTPRGIAS